MDDAQEWYWDLVANRAVRADERGPGDQVLGPYPTREAAENWKQRVESRNDEWEAADEAWEDADSRRTPDERGAADDGSGGGDAADRRAR